MEIDEFCYYSLRIIANVACFWKLGFTYGVVAIVAIHWLHYYVMWWRYGLVSLAPMDEMFLHEDPKNPCNVIGAFIFEKYDYE